VEADQVGFSVPPLPAEGGLQTQIDGCRKNFPIRQVGTAGVNAVGRQALVLGLQVGGGKAESGPATGALTHGPEKGEGPAQHGCRIAELAGGDGGPDPAAADPLPGKNNRFGIIQENFAISAPAGEESDIARAVFAKTPVRSNGDGLQRGEGRGQLLQEISRFLPGTVRIERQRHRHPDLPALKDAKFVGQAGKQERMLFRMKDRKRVVAEGEDGGLGGGVGGFSSENDPAVAEVKSVEKPEGEMTDPDAGGGGLEGIGDGHVRRMREISGSEIRWRAR